jgi:formate-dependent nitrite reductase cytochrome c552 subunit
MFSGEGVLTYEGTPDVMSSALGCADCHAEPKQGKTKEMVRAGCENCHDETYSEMMDQWQRDITARVDSLREKIESLKKIQKSSKATEEILEFLKSALKFSEIRLILVERDGSRGVHNYPLISQMLEEAALKLKNLDQVAR